MNDELNELLEDMQEDLGSLERNNLPLGKDLFRKALAALKAVRDWIGEDAHNGYPDRSAKNLFDLLNDAIGAAGETHGS